MDEKFEKSLEKYPDIHGYLDQVLHQISNINHQILAYPHYSTLLKSQ